jgi:hypothetical protein
MNKHLAPTSTVVEGSTADLETCRSIDALVQGAFVDLFQSYGVGLDPPARLSLEDAPTYGDVTTMIGFTRNSESESPRTGSLMLSMPNAILMRAKDDVASTGRDDWARELTNQLMGRIKNRLLHFGSTLQIGLPSSLDPGQPMPAQRSASTRVYGSRDVLIIVDGMPDESELSTVAVEEVPLEGAMLLF